SFSAGDTIFTAGSPGDCMFVVQAGEVEVAIDDAVVETVGPGGIIGEMGLIENQARSATAVARTDCKLVRIDEARLQSLVRQHPFFALEVMRVMAHRLRQMDARLWPPATS